MSSTSENITSFLTGLIIFGGLAAWFGYNYVVVAPERMQTVALQGTQFVRDAMKTATDEAREKGESVPTTQLDCVSRNLEVANKIIIESPKSRRIIAWNEASFGFGGVSDFVGLVTYYTEDDSIKSALYEAKKCK
jgi:hypothetical protein